jgi:RNA polymerase sigma-70 factor (ECF subfamily)
MTLEILVVKFQKKDTYAFEKLYEMYSKSMLGVINNIVRNDNVAEEILQDVFIKAWNNSENYNAKKGRFFTWILNIARNASIDYTRSKTYKESKQNQNSDYFVDILENNESLDSKTNTIGLKKFVKELSDKCKAVIEFLYLKGYTQKETSEELSIPLGTIKTRNRQCLEQLRIKLGV